jgi:xanthine dehydrogenase FAD-binding subunit
VKLAGTRSTTWNRTDERFVEKVSPVEKEISTGCILGYFMKIPCDEYLITHTVEETLAVITSAQGKARIVSGGSDFLLEMQQGSQPTVQTLVDVTEIEEMCDLGIRAGSLFIGASVTLSRLVNSGLIKQHAQALADAAALMANPQVCNVATIGGNVAHALPAADGTISLLALDAQAEVANINGRRKLPLQTLFNGPGKSALDPCGDLLVGFYLPLSKKGHASAFARRINPQGIALAILNMAVWLQRDGENITDIRIAVGPSGPVPLRMPAAEKEFLGRNPSAEVLSLALVELLKEAHFRTSPQRATAEYRRHLAEVLLQEAVNIAWQRAA